ncbi:hypothetical protein E4H04_07400 [Candidatus Bathyarchaeota archaeon]|nr:MAG: hypothetical protein E4H04_07400 [Candidatus Bathyarchaeota archaeon]
MNKHTRVLLIFIVAMTLIVPIFVSVAKKPEGPINVPNVKAVPVYTYTDLGNGNYRVVVEMTYDWECLTHPEFNGHVYQYAEGISRQKDGGMQFDNLHGYGVFTSTAEVGTITYKIHNNYYLDFTRFWADHLTIWKGTGYFENIRGYAEMDLATFSFNLYIHYEPDQ